MATNKTVTVTTAPTKTGNTVASYNVYSSSPAPGTSLGTMTTGEAAAGKVFSLTDGVTHSITVKAVWTTGGESTLSSNAVSVNLTIAAPTSLTVGTPTSSTIPLTWTKSITGVMTAYRVYDDGVLLQTFTGDVASGTLTGLTASTTYTNLTVRAYNGTSESASSNAVNGTTTAASIPDLYGLDFSSDGATHSITIPKAATIGDDISIKFGSANAIAAAANDYILGHGAGADTLNSFALLMDSTDATKVVLKFNNTFSTGAVITNGTVIRLLVESSGVSMFKDGTLVEKITGTVGTLTGSYCIGAYNQNDSSFSSFFKLREFTINGEVFGCEENTGDMVTGSLGTVCTEYGTWVWYTV